MIHEVFNSDIQSKSPSKALNEALRILDASVTILHLLPVTYRTTRSLVLRFYSSNLRSSHTPRSVVSVLLYYVTRSLGDYRTQQQITDAVGSCRSTIRHSQRKILAFVL